MTTDLVGAQLGEFEVVRELGRGGMGVVYEAIQTSLNRRVALKVLGSGLGLTPKAVARFRREAAAAAKLHHTNIVPVYSTGEDRGIHFYAMELIDGPSLDAVVRYLREQVNSTSPAALAPDLTATKPYTPVDPISTPSGSGFASSSAADRFDRIAAMFADVADALQHAHQSGVAHRDIKPSNLLLSADGRLSVTDFGLARMLEEPGMTVTGEFVGTPAYMSPEQITAGRIPVDRRTDIYSLGATLYELLTLCPPFVAEGRDRILAMVIQKEPAAPRNLNPRIPRDLETICTKCLEKDPDRRYQHAKDVAADLRRFLNRFAILAKRTGPLGKLKKWVKRNPALSAAALVVLLAVAAAGFFARQAQEAEQQRLAHERLREEQTQIEKRRATIERGMAAALAADLLAAEKAVTEAELLGASAGETRVLRGFIALYSGHAREAVGHFEQAVRLMPASVSARSLLACAHAEATDWEAARRVLAEVRPMLPASPEDKLFKGQAIALYHFAEGLRLMDEAMSERPSTVGHVLRAYAREMLAEDSGTVADAEAALADAEVAKRLLPGNPVTLARCSSARLTAASACERAGDAPRAAELRRAAERDADELLRFGTNPKAVSERYTVGVVCDGLAGKLDRTAELRAARTGTRNQWLANCEAYNWLCLGNDREAEAVAGEFPNERLNGHVRVLATLGRAGGRSEAKAALDAFAGADAAAMNRFEAAPLRFVLDPAGLRPAAVAIRNASASLNPRSPDETAWRLTFLDGQLAEADFLAAPLHSQIDRCYRHYCVAWKRLGTGDVAAARKAFEDAYRAMVPGYQCWWVARAVLIRMNADPQWPRGIAQR